MLSYQRHQQLQGLGVSKRHRALLSPNLRVYQIQTKGVQLDSEALDPLFAQQRSDRAQLLIVLDGELIWRRAGQELGAKQGEILAETGLGGSELWLGRSFRVLAIEWDTMFGQRFLAPTRLGRLDARSLVQLRQLCGEDRWGSGERDAPLARALMELLSALGALEAPIPITPLAQDKRLRMQRFMDALGHWSSHLSQQPRWQDLELTLKRSERQLRRDFQELMVSMGLPTKLSQMRRYMLFQRINAAVHYLSCQDVSVEHVAYATGYSSARAMCTAFSKEGLASPSQLQAHHKALNA